MSGHATAGTPLQAPRRAWRPGRVRRRGFSLAELMVVLIVMGLVGVIVAPRIEIMKYRIDGSSRGVTMAMLSAQRLAVKQQHDVWVAFDIPGRRLRIHEDRNNNGQVDQGERVRWVALGESVVFGLGSATPRDRQTAAVSFTGRQDGYPAVRFRRNGSASEEGSFYLTSDRSAYEGSAGEARYERDTRQVYLDRGTGRVSLFQHDASGWRQSL